MKLYTECLRKKKYKTSEFANKIKERIEKERNVKLYVYYCSFCFNYHITHHETYKGKVRR